ncbi:MAG TPA: hypothetical protein VNT77_01060 [Allosphingosinicella sp.]|nr:hypothetical protein [Allosphingosinicella sp.]
MPPRDPELPEGTDHIINGAMETSGAGGGGAGGGTGMTTGTGGASSGFVGSAASDDTGGTSMGNNTGGTDGTGDLKTQLRDGAASLQSQAGDKIRSYAETGKSRATTALDDFSQVVNDAADSIDERLGAEYGEYARRAADAVSGFADTLRSKEVDELFEDGRNLVRKSPGVALGVAAVVGFTLVRLVKAGMTEGGSGGGEREIEFEPDLNAGSGTSAGATGTATVTITTTDADVGAGAGAATGTGSGTTAGTGTGTGTGTGFGTGSSGSGA